MPNQDVRLLALDGGGVRGLSALMILQQLMDAVNPDAPPKPCDYFDMIAGTSTGGLIAIMLGRLKMSIDECIDAYLQLSDRIFQKKRHRATVKGKIQGRFDSDELERAVKEVIKGQGLQEDALLKDTPDASCKVFVCVTSKETSETVCLTSYKSPRGNNDLLNNVKIWEACRATSAASSFFDPIAIGRYDEGFVDGAAGANNPVVELWNQAQLMWGPDPLEGKVQCLVSIGTGIPSLKPFRDDLLHIGETLIAIATETEQTAERFRRDKAYLDSSNRYFRFNVVRGLEDIGLEESTKRKEIAAATRRYVASQDAFKQMQACVGNLASREYVGEYRTNFSIEGIRLEEEIQRCSRRKKWRDREGLPVPCSFPLQRNESSVVHILERHSSNVSAVAFSPDGWRVASASYDRTVRLWDARSRALVKTLRAHSKDVKAVAFSPDGRRLASASADRTVRLWDAESETPMQTLEGHSDEVFAVAFSPDGGLLASASSDQTVRLWDAGTGMLVQTLKGHSTIVCAVAFSPDGGLLASASWDWTARLWDAESWTLVHKIEDHSNWVNAVAFSPDGRRLASASSDETVRLWDAGSGTPIQTLEGHSGAVFAVAFSPDGRLLASASSDGTVRLWDAEFGTPMQTLEGHSNWVNSVAFSSDSKLLASASYDSTVRLWDVGS